MSKRRIKGTNKTGRPNSISRRRLLLGAMALTGGIAFAGGWDSTSVQVRREDLSLPQWDADGFKLVQLSDLHINSDSQRDRAAEAIRLALQEKADLIAITGDFLDEFRDGAAERLQQTLEPLSDAGCPVLAILGNHDWAASPQAVAETLRKSPARLLRNEAAEIGGVSIVGVDDACFDAGNLNFIRDRDYSRSLIALWHEPDAVLKMYKKASLQLSGHSHGGEICLPGGIPVHTPRLAKIYTGGFYPSARVPLYVSRGVATVGPFRLYCPPEISVLTLRSSA